MLSISAHPGIKGAFTCPSLPHQNPNASARFFKTPCSFKLQTPSSMKFNDTLYHKFTPIKKTHRISASSAVQEAEAVVTETPPDSVPDQEIEKTIEKPRLVLKFIWMEKNIGLGLDQVIPGHGHIPLSPYYFWPRKDAWEELKTTLESKPWISQKKMIILLNQATDIINLWQQSGGSLTSQ